MTLDAKRHAILDVFCHVYENIVGYLNVFEAAAQTIIDCDCYMVVKECFDPAVQEFGKNPPSTDEKKNLLEDLLNKIGALFTYKYSSNDDLINSFQNYKNIVLGSSIISLAMIDKFQEVGEKLSHEWYSSFCNPEYQGLRRSTSLIITPSNETTIACFPRKSNGISEIHLKFGVADFDFKTYINLPFYFFHEYLSHIHSADLFNESNPEQTSIFEDGWLVCIAYQKYKNYIRSKPKFAEELPHKEHYLKSYIYSVTDNEKGDKYTKKGYELTEKFTEIVGEDLCHKISFLLTITDYNSLTGYSPLHSKFLFIINKWLVRYFKMNDNEKKEEIELLDLAIEDEDPLKSLLEVME